MKSHAQVAVSVRTAKQAHPERYCAEPRCLWRLKDGAKYCPRHKRAES